MAFVKQYESGISNGFFIVDRDVIAVDTGAESDEIAIQRVFRETGVEPSSVKLIVITHGHVDHFLNLSALKTMTRAPVLCHKLAAPYLIEGRPPDIVARSDLGQLIIDRQIETGPPIVGIPKVTPDIIIEGKTCLRPWGVNGYLIPTPGHSRGCISVVLDSGEAIIGDMFVQVPEIDQPCPAFFTYPGGMDGELIQSLKSLLEIDIHTFYSGHGGPFSRSVIEDAIT